MKTPDTKKARIRKFSIALMATISLPFSYALADTVVIPLGQQGKAWNVDAPSRGLSQEQVETRYGNPMEIIGPIGDPPIITWEYDRFRVYFEGRTVIHSVVKAANSDFD